MRLWWRVFFQAFGVVMFTSLNVRMLMAESYVGAFPMAFCVSWLWWENSKATRPNGVRYQWAYAIGSGFGTVTGMWLSKLW